MNSPTYWRHSSLLLNMLDHITLDLNSDVFTNVELRIRVTVTSVTKGLVQGARQ